MGGGLRQYLRGLRPPNTLICFNFFSMRSTSPVPFVIDRGRTRTPTVINCPTAFTVVSLFGRLVEYRQRSRLPCRVYQLPCTLHFASNSLPVVGVHVICTLPDSVPGFRCVNNSQFCLSSSGQYFVCGRTT